MDGGRLKRPLPLVFAGSIVALVFAFATLNPAPVRPLQPTPEQRRELFERLVENELAAREEAKDDWAHHRWSQQDAFGAKESDRVSKLAGERGFAAQDLFLVIDEGLRSKWTTADGGVLPATIVPLKPRPND